MKMKTSPNDASNNVLLTEIRSIVDSSQAEVLEAIHELSSQTDERFNRLEVRMDKSEFRLNRVESLMVTKDYLDDKLADLRSDISQNTAKQIEKALN